jgi:KWG Leptospira.
MQNNRWGFLDSKGKEIIPIMYDDVYEYHNGYAAVLLNGRIGIIDTKGELIYPISIKASDVLVRYDDNLMFSKINGVEQYFKILPDKSIIYFYDK